MICFLHESLCDFSGALLKSSCVVSLLCGYKYDAAGKLNKQNSSHRLCTDIAFHFAAAGFYSSVDVWELHSGMFLRGCFYASVCFCTEALPPAPTTSCHSREMMVFWVTICNKYPIYIHNACCLYGTRGSINPV